MVIEYPALGAVIVHQYYPGFVDLPAGSDYLIDSPDAQGLIRVAGHVRPLVIVDFNNELVNRPHKHGVHTDIKRPIRGINRSAISADAVGHEGRKALILAVEKEINGRIFHQDIYTSLEVRWEVPTERAAQDLRPFDRLLVRFISTYRYLNPDTRLILRDGIPDDSTPRRVALYPYSDADLQSHPVERLARAPAKDPQLSILSYHTAGRALQDHAEGSAALATRGKTLAGYLASGFALPETLLAIERLANLAFTLGQPRSAVVEAMSILELGVLAHQRKVLPQLDASGKVTKENEPTWKFLINAILPALLDLYDGDKGGVMRQAQRALDLRHKVAHAGHVPSPEDANLVLSCVRTILSIFELPEIYKGNWKRKPI
ncbi:MAG: hypothetical protein JSR91_16595 [Proteobacteria bacterium]|nr:hypothetical protein [Pseudomonadota bacterium]